MRASLLLVLAACGGGDPVPVAATDTGFDGTVIPVGTYDDILIEEGAPVLRSLRMGSFWPFPGYEATGVGGQVQVASYLDGRTEISLGLGNLAPNTEHAVHVHTQPCASYAGPHYLIDPTVVETDEANELWPPVLSNASGIAEGWLETGEVRGDALSVVVHDPATGDKMACADLEPGYRPGERASGAVVPFAQAEALDGTIAGTASIVLGDPGQIDLTLTGLDPASTYSAHVHTLPCGVADAGGHYKLDPSIEETLPENEVWPYVTVGADGSSDNSLFLSDPLREDAASVVVHRVAADGSPKVACADLVRDSYTSVARVGEPVLLDGAEDYGVDGLKGTITVTRRLDGVSEATLDLEGLAPRETYPVHLHAAPCDAYQAGDHYFIDPTLDYVDEANELWLSVTSKPKGGAKRTVAIPHLLRGEAQAFILHHADGARLACIDLY